MDAKTDIAAAPLASLEVKHGALAPNRPVRLQNAGLDERGDEIFAHGWLDLEAMRALRVDDYQRAVLIGSNTGKGKRHSIVQALQNGVRPPDIMIGMRGEKYDVEKNDMVLHSKCYIVDGLQRVAAYLQYAENNPDEAKALRIGAEVRFGTTKESEQELFLKLNTTGTRVSPNVILRNQRQKHTSILTLYGLTKSEPKFALYERVCWEQTMARSELLTALIMTRVGLALLTGTARTEHADRIGHTLDGAIKRSPGGLALFRKNMITFFDVIDQVWGIRTIHYQDKATQLRGNFLVTLASLFHSHSDFWREGREGELFVGSDFIRKLKTFPIHDPDVARLAGAGTMAKPVLEAQLINHLNHKKKASHRLHKRSIITE